MYRLLLVCLVHDLDGGVFGFPFPPFPIFSLDSYNPLMYNVCVYKYRIYHYVRLILLKLQI